MASWLGFPLEDRLRWKDTFIDKHNARKSQAILFVRVCLVIFWFGITLWSLLDTGKKAYWIIHLTIWSALLLLAYLDISAYATYMALYGEDEHGEGSDNSPQRSESGSPDGKGPVAPWYANLAWVLGTMVPAQCTLVAIMFWVAVYPNKPAGSLRPVAFWTHGANMVVALVDIAISNRPFYMRHVYAGFLFNLAYAIWTLIFYVCGGHRPEDPTKRYIYKVISWSQPTSTALKLVGLLFIVLPCVHAVYVLLFQCRRKLCPLPSSDDESLLAGSESESGQE